MSRQLEQNDNDRFYIQASVRAAVTSPFTKSAAPQNVLSSRSDTYRQIFFLFKERQHHETDGCLSVSRIHWTF